MWPFKKKKLQIRLELTYPWPGRRILWAVIPGGYSEDYAYDEWLKIAEYEHNLPPPPDPNLVNWSRRDV